MAFVVWEDRATIWSSAAVTVCAWAAVMWLLGGRQIGIKSSIISIVSLLVSGCNVLVY